MTFDFQSCSKPRVDRLAVASGSHIRMMVKMTLGMFHVAQSKKKPNCDSFKTIARTMLHEALKATVL